MTAYREKDQADFDLEAFVDLFDTAMTSNNPTVQRAFKNLLMVSAIVNGELEDQRQGPLRRLVEDVKELSRRLSSLELKNLQESSGFKSPWNNVPVVSDRTTPWNSGVPETGTGTAPYTITGPYTTTTSGLRTTSDAAMLDAISDLYKQLESK